MRIPIVQEGAKLFENHTFDRARIVALHKEGMEGIEIAKAIGCKRGNVYKALRPQDSTRLAGASAPASDRWF